MATKMYKARFFQGTSASGTSSVSAILKSVVQNRAAPQAHPIVQLGEYKYQLRELVSVNNGAVFKGSFGKLRDDAPHIITRAGDEETIDLDDDEYLIEKNYFLYYSRDELMVYQVNRPGSDVSRLGQYLGEVAEEQDTIALSDILMPDTLATLLRGDVKSVEVSFARPKKLRNIVPQTNWNQNMMSLLSGAGAGRISVKVSTQSRTQALAGDMKKVIKELLQFSETRGLKVKFADVDRPIDLIAECVQDSIEVAMDGKYPKPASIYAALDKARERQKENIEAYLSL